MAVPLRGFSDQNFTPHSWGPEKHACCAVFKHLPADAILYGLPGPRSQGAVQRRWALSEVLAGGPGAEQLGVGCPGGEQLGVGCPGIEQLGVGSPGGEQLGVGCLQHAQLQMAQGGQSSQSV